MDLRSTLSIRGSKYGPWGGQSLLAQQLKSVVRAHNKGNGWANLSASQKEGLDMILHKISRVVNGDPDYDDSWVDIAGYAQRVVEENNAARAKRVAVPPPQTEPKG